METKTPPGEDSRAASPEHAWHPSPSLGLAETQRQAGEWETSQWKGRLQVCPHGGWGLESLEQGTPRLVRAASGFLWWVLSWQRGQKLGKLSVIDQVRPFGADCDRVAVWLPAAGDTGLTPCEERRLGSCLVTAGEGLLPGWWPRVCLSFVFTDGLALVCFHAVH